MVGRSVESERQTDVHMACAPNRRLAKIHRSNPVAAVTTLYGRRSNTGREGMWRGRRMTDDNRPAQMLGCAMAARHRARQLKPPRPCRPGALYGVRCRIQRDPVGGTVEYQPVTAALGNPMGIQSSPRSRDELPRQSCTAAPGAWHADRHGAGRGATGRAECRTAPRAVVDDDRRHDARRTRAVAGGDRSGAADPSRHRTRRDQGRRLQIVNPRCRTYSEDPHDDGQLVRAPGALLQGPADSWPRLKLRLRSQ